MHSHNKAFGKVLRELRQSRGASQESLAWDAQLARTYISLLELGQRSPTLDTMLALCGAFKITLSELATRVEAKIAEDSRNG